MIKLERNISAGSSILRSIREHLTASGPYDAVQQESEGRPAGPLDSDTMPPQDSFRDVSVGKSHASGGLGSLIEIFRENLEAVGGHCIVVGSEAEASQAVTSMIEHLQSTRLRARRIALSDSSAVERVFRNVNIEVDEVSINPDKESLFGYDVGVSAAQAAVAETGTLVLESDEERHRLVSLVPPVHIAIIEADKIFLTIGEALAKVNRTGEPSPTITLITGPSRTADIELTLAIGVHGPQELYVIVNKNF